MESFEDLGLDASLVEALAAEGHERPSAFQQAAIPVLRRGNNLVGQVGPGSGSFVAYAAAMLDRLEPEGPSTRALVLTPTAEGARRCALGIARLATVTGHSVAALGSPWALPEKATVLCGTPGDVLAAVASSTVKLDAVEILVLDEAGALGSLGELAAVEVILESAPSEAQKVVLAVPLDSALARIVDGHVRKAVHLPPRPVDGASVARAPARGEVSYVVRGEGREDAVLEVVAAALSDEARHVLVYVSSEDAAADLGDFLVLHGFLAGPPGDASVPVWLGVDEREGRAALTAFEDPGSVATLSADVPPDVDSLDRRHGAGRDPCVLLLPRELPHLRDIARQGGYALRAEPSGLPEGARTAVTRLRDRVAEEVETGNLLGEMLLLQPLFQRWSPAEVAGALLSLLRRVERDPGAAEPVRPGRDEELPGGPTWTRLFVSVGSRDGAGPGDLVGAISGEAGVKGSQIGKIDVKDTFSLVEVETSVAQRVIRSLNGTSIRGRSARVDFDRGSRGVGRSPRGKGSRPRGGPGERHPRGRKGNRPPPQGPDHG